MQKAAHAYLQTQVTTTSQGDILIMLYDGAINFLNKAKGYLAANDMAQKGIYISKALDILNELDSTLNLEKGGDLATNLHNLYFFCNSRLLMANLKKDAKMIDEALIVLTGLRSAYAEINSRPEAIAAAQEAAANQHAKASQPQRSGTVPVAETAPLPGASTRARALYAQKASEVAPEQGLDTAERHTALPQEGEGETCAAEKTAVAAETTPGQTAALLSSDQSASAVPPSASEPGPNTPSVAPVSGTSLREDNLASAGTIYAGSRPVGVPSFGTSAGTAAGGFGGKRAGSDLYRKFAG